MSVRTFFHRPKKFSVKVLDSSNTYVLDFSDDSGNEMSVFFDRENLGLFLDVLSVQFDLPLVSIPE